MKISLILPVYNVEQYVAKCLQSCLNQDIPSSDYVVSQENAGLSAARNKGLSLAKGDYVWFIDTDDYIKNNCLGEIYTEMSDSQLEALAISAVRITNDGEITKTYTRQSKGCCTGVEMLYFQKYLTGAQFTIYKREFLIQNNLRFKTGVYHEDNEFTPRAYYVVKRIANSSIIGYHFRFNPNSITNSVNYKRSYDCIIVAESLIHYLKHNVSKEHKHFFYDEIRIMINSAISNIANSNNKVEEVKFGNYLYKKKHIFKYMLSSSLLYKVEKSLFLLFPKFIIQIYKLSTKIKCK